MKIRLYERRNIPFLNLKDSFISRLDQRRRRKCIDTGMRPTPRSQRHLWARQSIRAPATRVDRGRHLSVAVLRAVADDCFWRGRTVYVCMGTGWLAVATRRSAIREGYYRNITIVLLTTQNALRTGIVLRAHPCCSHVGVTHTQASLVPLTTPYIITLWLPSWENWKGRTGDNEESVRPIWARIWVNE